MSAISATWFYVGWGAVKFETNYGLMQQSPPEITEKLLKALDKEYNVVDMAAVVEIVSILEKTPITKEALEITRLGKYINELRKRTTNDILAKRAKDLVRRWRDMILPQREAGGGTAIAVIVASQHNGASGRMGCSGVSGRVSGPSVISPALSLPSSDLSNTSPTLSRVEAVPRTHASNKRLRKEISPSLIPVTELEGPPAKSARLNGECYAGSIGSDCCEIVSVVPASEANSKKCRKRILKQRGGDVLKEKMASITRTPRVKTTQELLADLRERSGDAPGENHPALANCVVPGADQDITRNKTEHIAKFLRSQSELVAEDIDMMRGSEKELRPKSDCQSSLGAHSIPTTMEIMDTPTPPPEDTPERTLAEILSRLPPLDLDAIVWEEYQASDPGTPPPRVVTEEQVVMLQSEHTEGINGNFSQTNNSSDNRFCEWHEMLSRTSYQGDLLHILPYVVID